MGQVPSSKNSFNSSSEESYREFLEMEKNSQKYS